MFLKLFASRCSIRTIFGSLIKAGFVPALRDEGDPHSELGDFHLPDPPPVACGCAFDAQVDAPRWAR